jgi:hypothetical protein
MPSPHLVIFITDFAAQLRHNDYSFRGSASVSSANADYTIRCPERI